MIISKDGHQQATLPRTYVGNYLRGQNKMNINNELKNITFNPVWGELYVGVNSSVDGIVIRSVSNLVYHAINQCICSALNTEMKQCELRNK
jgi:hypothetical protein